VLLVSGQRVAYLNAKIAEISSAVAFPFQVTVDTPIRFFNWIVSGITTQRDLIHENEKLRVQQILLEARLQKFLTLEKENIELRQLLQSTSQVSGKITIGRILAVSLNPNMQEVFVNKGVKEGIFQGQPVFDAHGVMGQVASIGLFTSRILLVTDPQSAVPVQDYRNGMRAIAVGTGASGQLTLINVPDTNDIQVGDLFVTSGLGLNYPTGYPVAMVSKIEKRGSGITTKILLTPMAHVTQATQVLLLWPDQKGISKEMHEEVSAGLAAEKKANQS